MTKIGVIGVGQMGSAIIKGLKKDATNKIIGENQSKYRTINC